MTLVNALWERCRIYDLYLACLLLEFQNNSGAARLDTEIGQVRDEMSQKAAKVRLAVVNYFASFTTLQNVARYVDAIKNNGGQLPWFMEDIVERYNKVTRDLDPKKTEVVALEKAAAKINKLCSEKVAFLDGGSIIDKKSGLIKEMSPGSKQIAKNTVFKRPDKKEEEED